MEGALEYVVKKVHGTGAHYGFNDDEERSNEGQNTPADFAC
jgi:hypothetical protein